MGEKLNTLKITDHFIPDITWNEIPQFAVITGVNGSGKTQLLNAINSIILKNNASFKHETDINIERNQFGFVPWNNKQGSLGGAHYADFERKREAFIQQCLKKQIRQKEGDENWEAYKIVKQEMGIDPQQQGAAFFKTSEFRDS